MSTTPKSIELDIHNNNNNVPDNENGQNFTNLSEIAYFEGTYEEFFHNFLLTNTPCLIPNIIKDWNCLLWVEDDKPNFNYLESKYGDATVPVANCGKKYYNSQCKNDMKFKKFLQYWKQFIDDDYPSTQPCLYLKDWHFMKEFPEEDAYIVPEEFGSDWLNEYYTDYEQSSDDYRFVYMGPKGSWTPFHADVFTSYSWSVNICGEKKWVLLPPGEEEKLRNKLGNLPFDLNDNNNSNNNKNVKFITVTQKAGVGIFVPSGWHHQVWNTADTISVNHNWINACNIDRMWLSMKSSLKGVKQEISNFRHSMENWEEHCQLILKSCFGMDFKDFYNFILYIFEVRKTCIENKYVHINSGRWKVSPSHLKYDYLRVRDMFNKFVNDTDLLLLLKGNPVEALLKKQ